MTLGIAARNRVTNNASGTAEKAELEVGGRQLRLTNLDRILFPEAGFTKRDLIDYYAAISPVLLPHLRDRPLSMRRFPDGVEEQGFWEKHCPEHRPKWVQTDLVTSESSRDVEYCLINDLPTLLWVANLACIELHVSLARSGKRSNPDSMVFDLDPGEPANLLDCAEIALLIRDTLAGQGLDSLAKVSGSKGIQLYVPLNSGASYETTGGFAHSVARAFESEMPEHVVSKMRKSLRKGKVLIDWSQNSEHKTTVAAYSMRARSTPSISMPVSWSRLKRALARSDSSDLRFTPERAIRSGRRRDGFERVLKADQRLPA